MEVKEMTIADVLKTPAFYNNLKVVISDLENIRRKAGMMADAPLKRHPIDRLQERGVFEPGQMTVLYATQWIRSCRDIQVASDNLYCRLAARLSIRQ